MLSQCLTQCIMRIVNEVDQKSVAVAVEGVGRDLLGNLPALSKGQAIIAGSCGQHAGHLPRAPAHHPARRREQRRPAEWQNQFSDTAVAARERDTAPLARDNKPFSIFKS